MVLDEQEFQLLRDFISERFGVYFSDQNRWMLESKLVRIIPVRFKSFFEYYQYLIQKFYVQQSFLDPDIIDLVRAITNHETYFFRETGGLDAVRQIIASDTTKYWRILSAGCSTGEEVYTIAMLMLEVGIPVSGTAVVGIDLDGEVIKKAIEGVYSTQAFRGVEDQFFHNGIKVYFDLAGKNKEMYRVKSSLKNIVKFQQANLVDPDSLSGIGTFDIVLCRNVLIYFNESERKKTVAHLGGVLNRGGYLSLGHSELLWNADHGLQPVEIAGHFMYQNKDAG